MKKNSKQSILLLSIGGILFICLVGVYLSRSILLRSIANKRTTHIEQTYGLHIHYENLEMCSLNEVSIQGLSVVPEQRDTLLTLQTVNVKLTPWKLLKGNFEVRNIRMDGLTIAFIKRDSVANYDFLFSKRQCHNQTCHRKQLQPSYRPDIELNIWLSARKRTTDSTQYNRTERQQFCCPKHPRLHD